MNLRIILLDEETHALVRRVSGRLALDSESPSGWPSIRPWSAATRNFAAIRRRARGGASGGHPLFNPDRRMT